MKFDLPPEIHNELRRRAKDAGLTIDELASRIVGDYLTQTRIATAPRLLPGMTRGKLGPDSKAEE